MLIPKRCTYIEHKREIKMEDIKKGVYGESSLTPSFLDINDEIQFWFVFGLIEENTPLK